jgi:hypothetical protein
VLHIIEQTPVTGGFVYLRIIFMAKSLSKNLARRGGRRWCLRRDASRLALELDLATSGSAVPPGLFSKSDAYPQLKLRAIVGRLSEAKTGGRQDGGQAGDGGADAAPDGAENRFFTVLQRCRTYGAGPGPAKITGH